jgi:hypothetical protein
VSKEKYLPDKKDETPENVATRLGKLDMFNEIYVHVGKEEEMLNASTYPQPSRRICGVAHSENFQVDGFYVDNLHHYPINNWITKSMCVPMPNYIYDLKKNGLGKNKRYHAECNKIHPA